MITKKVNIQVKQDWHSKPSVDGLYLMRDERGKVTFEIVYAVGSEDGARVINEGRDSEPIQQPFYKGCQWSGPIKSTTSE